METATVEKTLYCDEIPNVTINASEDASVKVVINVVTTEGKKISVTMGQAGAEDEMARAGMIVARDYSGFAVAGKGAEYTLSELVNEDEFSALLCLINKYPTMAEIFREKAEELGRKYDAIAAGHEPQAPDDAMQAMAELNACRG